MSLFIPIQRGKSIFLHWYSAAAAAAARCQITSQTRQELLPVPGQHKMGRLGKEKGWQHTATSLMSAGPAQGSAGQHLPRAACYSLEHCKAHITPPANDLCLESGHKVSAHPSATSHIHSFPNSQYDLTAVSTAITFPVLNWLGQSRENMGVGCIQMAPATHLLHSLA